MEVSENPIAGVFRKFISENTSIPVFGNELPNCIRSLNFLVLSISTVYRNMSDNQPARIRQEVKEVKKVSTGSTSCSRGVKEVKEKKKVSTGSTSRSQGPRGPDAQAQLSGVRVVIDADGSETE